MDTGNQQFALDLLTKGWDGLLSGSGRGFLESVLPAWLERQRWFGAKTRSLAQASIGHWIVVPVAASGLILPSAKLPVASTLGDVILLLDLAYTDGSRERYQLPLAYASGAELEALERSAPGSIEADVGSPTGNAAFYDAVSREGFRQALLALVEGSGRLAVENSASASEVIAATLVAAHESRPAHEVLGSGTRAIAAAIEASHSIDLADVAPEFIGHMPGAVSEISASSPLFVAPDAELRCEPSEALASVRGEGPLPARVGSAEQSNTNIVYGSRILLKLFRRLQPGLNPDVEIGRFLTDVAHFERIAPFLGEITLQDRGGDRTSLAMVQGLVANEGDGWQWTLTQMAAFFKAASRAQGTEKVEALAGTYLEAAALLGKRTAEMHLALATPTDDKAFAAEPYTRQDHLLDAARLEAQIHSALDALESGRARLSDGTQSLVAAVLRQREHLLQTARAKPTELPGGLRIRIHGDYHLGQILRAQEDFVLLDFEGEPARSLQERRCKQSPLRDVAGMLRSFSYAAASALNACAPYRLAALAPWAGAWEAAVCRRFLESYRTTAATSSTLLPGPAEVDARLNGYVLEKALYELLYELNNRPGWVGIPLAGILKIAGAAALS